MTIYIYPENWEEPDPEPVVELTPSERATLKTRMQTYITNQAKPIALFELLQTAHDWLIEVHNKHLTDACIVEIAMEIREEWGYPGQVV